jgi:hypothetical protein
MVWGVVVVVCLGACGGDDDDGGGGGADAAPPADGDVPTPDGAPACSVAGTTVFAISQLHWGEGNSGEWKSMGFDLDGLASTAASTDVCQPNSGGQAGVAHPDGNEGRDNSFGKNILPTLLALYPTWASDTNNSLDMGAFNTLLELSCLPPAGDVPALTTKLFVASPLGALPKFDGTDVFAVDPGFLSNPMDPASTVLVFPDGSVTGATFEAGPGGTVVLSVPMSTQTGTSSFTITLHAPRITMTLSADRKSATGMIGGVLNTEELVTEVREVGAAVGLCGNAVLDNLVTQIRQSSDILSDGTQDPAKTCDGISFGIAFEVVTADRGAVGAARPVDMGCP